MSNALKAAAHYAGRARRAEEQVAAYARLADWRGAAREREASLAEWVETIELMLAWTKGE